jgi:hypothetical protein
MRHDLWRSIVTCLNLVIYCDSLWYKLHIYSKADLVSCFFGMIGHSGTQIVAISKTNLPGKEIIPPPIVCHHPCRRRPPPLPSPLPLPHHHFPSCLPPLFVDCCVAVAVTLTVAIVIAIAVAITVAITIAITIAVALAVAITITISVAVALAVGTLEGGYVHNGPLPRIPQTQSTSPVACAATLTESTDIYYSKVTRIPTWSELRSSLKDLGKTSLMPFSLVC